MEDSNQEEISDEQYAIWLEKYGAIFMFHHLDQNYIFRRLSRREYRAVMAIDDELIRTEEVVQSCLLYPRGWKADSDEVQEGLAGVPDTICEQILKASGVLGMENVLEHYKKLVNSDLESQMESIIDHVFCGGAVFGKYQDWSHDQLFDAYSRAEWILVNIEGKKIEATKQEQAKPKQQRSLGGPDAIKRRSEELQKLHDEQMKGSNAHTEADGLIDSFDSDRMALKPMTEVMQKFEKTQRRQAIMKQMNKE